MSSSALSPLGNSAARGRSLMRARALFLASLSFALSLLLFGHRALAQGAGDIEVSAQASAREVEVGEPFTVQLKALSANSTTQPSDPELRVPAGLVASGPQVSSQSFMQFGAGGSVVKTGIGAAWQVVASTPGNYVIAGPSVRWRGKRVAADKIAIRVVQATGRPRRPQSPFLLPGGPSGGFNLPWPFGSSTDLGDDDELDTTEGRELSLPTAPESHVFLRAMVDKTTAVVGEQITLSIYQYSIFDLDFNHSDMREAPLPHFFRYSLVRNPGVERPVLTRVGGRPFTVQILNRLAIFPLRAGDLHTGSMSLRYTGRRVGNIVRRSNDLVIKVTEPPAQGRPAGYVLGDVGQFSMTATVQPRKLDEGGSVAVQIRVQGTGNFPQSLRIPERTALEWSDPEKREAIEPVGGKVTGWRSFGYVVRVKETGKVSLGDVELAFWDPAAQRYEVAKASLGEINVKRGVASPSPSGQPSAGPADDGEAAAPFAAIPGARAALGAYTPPSPPLLEGARLWWLIAAPPALFGLFVAGSGAAVAFARRRDARRTAPVTLTERALKDAEQAEAKGDAKDLAAALERALHNAIEHATGLKARGVLLRELPAELEARGLDADSAGRVHEVLTACETIRFDPGATPEAIRDLRDRAQTLARDLARRKAA